MTKLNTFVGKDMSVFKIIDEDREFKGIGLDEDCLDKILEFIKSSTSKDSIKLYWQWFDECVDYTIDDDMRCVADGDIIVSVYGPDEETETRTLSNWSYAEDLILGALYS